MASFGARDLANLLPDEVGDLFSLRHTATSEVTDSLEMLKPKRDESKKVTRYFPGKAPTWGDQQEENEEQDDSFAFTLQGVGLKGEVPTEERVSDVPVSDSRLARLSRISASKQEEDTADAAPATGRGRRRVFQAEVIEDNEATVEVGASSDTVMDIEEHAEIDEEDAIAARRERIKERLLVAEREKSLALVAAPQAAEDVSSSEYETDSEEEEDDPQVMLKPVFVPKHQRETILAAEHRSLELQIMEQKKEIQVEDKKRHTRVLVAESLRRISDKEASDAMMTDGELEDQGLPDDTDLPNDQQEFEKWKIREMTRLMRESVLEEGRAAEKQELEARKNMTDEQRLAEQKAARAAQLQGDEDMNNKGDKPQRKFLQKYYHKGAFYMDDDTLAKDKTDVRKLDYNEPTLEDKYNRESLPAVMQVKKFGMRGRTKYTHLKDQDTTERRPKAGELYGRRHGEDTSRYKRPKGDEQ